MCIKGGLGPFISKSNAVSNGGEEEEEEDECSEYIVVVVVVVNRKIERPQRGRKRGLSFCSLSLSLILSSLHLFSM